MITGARNRIEVPAVPVWETGIMQVANVVDSTDPHDLLGVQAETDACGTAYEWAEFCTQAGVHLPSYVPPSTGLKDFDNAPEFYVGDPFTVYAGVECDFQNVAEAKTRAEKRLAYGEGRAVDAAMLTLLDDMAEAVDPTSGPDQGPYSPGLAVALLETYARSVYGGVPTILMPMWAVGCDCNCFVTNLDGTLTSRHGSKIGSFARLPALPTPLAFATGQITLVRGPVLSLSVPSQNLADGDVSPPRALAERVYVPLIECFAVTVEVTCPT